MQITTAIPAQTRRISLTRISARGVLWALLQNVNIRAINFLSQLVLARILLPTDFGTIGLAYTITTVVGTLTGFGMDDVVLARPKALRLWATPAFGATLTLSLVAAGIMLIAAHPMALVYRTPALVGLIGFLAVEVVVNSVATVPETLMRKDLRFRLLASYGLWNVVVTQALTILLAWKGFGAYAFVLPLPIAAGLRSAVFYCCAPIGTRGMFRFRRWLPLLGRGALVFGQRAINTARDQGDYFILGITASSAVVGTYMLAFRLAAQPVYTLANSLNTVLLPTLGALGNDRGRQTAATIRAIRIVAFTVIPFCFLQASVAGPLINALFGPEWSAAVPLTQILSTGLAFDIIPCVACSLAIARGRFHFQFVNAALSFPFFVVFIVVGAHQGGAIGVASAVVCFFILSSIVYSYFALAPLQRPVAVLAELWAVPALLSTAAAGASVAIGRADALIGHPLIGALICFSCGGVVYVSLFCVLFPETVRQMRTEFDAYRLRSANS